MNHPDSETTSYDPFLALLVYRATPLPWCGFSPAKLLMGRNVRTNIPQATDHLVPQLPNYEKFRQDDKKFKKQQKANYDHRHRVRERSSIPEDMEVWITTDNKQIPGRVTSTAETPRLYYVDTPTGILQRNRGDLNVMPSHHNTDKQTQTVRSPIATRSKSGILSEPPQKLWKGDVV